jgi:hypothetical protein
MNLESFGCFEKSKARTFWWAHQIVSSISNSESTIFLKEYIFVMISFSTGKLRKNICFGPKQKKFVFFFNCSNLQKFVDKLGEIGEIKEFVIN